MNEKGADLLAQLRDIHAASEPSWWPPAPGWWLLSAVVLAVLVLALRAGLRRLKVARRRRVLLRAVDALRQENPPEVNPHDYLAALNRLFRVVALRAFPDTRGARLEGQAWVRFIAELMPGGTRLAALDALASGPYQPRPEFDAAGLDALARQWIRRYG